MAQKGGPRLRGQRLLDNAPCQATVNLGSSALLFPRYCALLVQHRPDRHAKGSPSGRAGERSETERASPGQKRLHAAISRFFVRAILSLCFYISVSILALSVIASQCHLSQRERLSRGGKSAKSPPHLCGGLRKPYAVLSDGVRLVCKICMVCIHALSLGVALLEELGRDLREHGVGQNVPLLPDTDP